MGVLNKQLEPLLGRQQAEAVVSMCHCCAWYLLHTAKGRHSDAEVELLWMDYHARRMGFDEVQPASANHAMAMLCLHRWRLETAEYVGLSPGVRQVREAAVQIAEAEVKQYADPAVVDIVLEMVQELRQST